MIYNERLKQLLAYLEKEKLQAAMITSPTNIYFLTGFYADPHERFMALFLNASQGHVQLFVPSLDLESAEAKAQGVDQIIPVSDTDNPYQVVREQIAGGFNQLGVEKKGLSLFQAESLQEVYPGVKFSDVEAYITSMRLIKSKEDIQIVRRAIEVVENVLQHGVSKVAPGVTELEITAELEYQMKVLGADRPAFSTIVLSGAQSALPHGRPGTKKIESGELLLFDLGVFVDGYCSDITRTFVVGEATAEQRKMYEAVRVGNEKAIQAVADGKPIGLLDQAARAHIEAEGLGQYFIHRVGHGLGLDVHEAPSIHSQNEMLMQPGFLFTIEPGVYIPGVGGVRIEDDVYIGEDGKAEVLTSYPKELKEL
ncbi:Xaa-Pro peptidase family protein [Ammoniphilus sp. YIM 78166]|uniref:M24 family metallopeptidase n=1 Tax=Ammoniphilus sp. YIM 78166 TaxID=1644106 RepID=UPI00106F85BB|nr:Xaa-Pro peptidase family protein [Ammoniphilus sp. YIM 78166]